MSFSHLHVQSAFSFLDASSSVDSLVLKAAELGQPALALTDTNSLTGVVSLVQKCSKVGIKPIAGCDVHIDGEGHLTLLADGPRGWKSLCRILTAAGLRDVKRQGMRVTWEDLEAFHDGIVCLTGSARDGLLPRLLRRRQWGRAEEKARRLLALFGPGSVCVEVTRTLTEGEDRLSRQLFELAEFLHIPPVATNPVRHAAKDGLPAYEALCRVRLGLNADDQHVHLPFNGEGFLKDEPEMAALFADRPDALQTAALLADRLAPPLDPTAHHLPRYPHLPEGESSFSYLAALTWNGAKGRYEKRFTEAVKTRLVHELETVRDLGFCDYFLVAWDVGREARRRNVGFALRGSAVGSAVAHCLGLSEHDPISRNVSFERFLSKGRAKPPDIDIDFRHDERDAMMDYVRETYGQDKVANVSNYVTFRGRSLLRDIGKVMGFEGGELEKLRELLGHCKGEDLQAHIEEMPELRALNMNGEMYADLFALCGQLAGLPRHLGTHSSGIVVSDVPLSEVCPVQWAAKGVPVCCLDKDDVEAAGIGLLKMDQLSLRALTAIDFATETLTAENPQFDYAGRDREDPETLSMIRAAQTVTCFQLESPAQMALQWRLKADKFDDLVALVALIRPGPLLGKTVEPYIHRRHGWEPVTYPLPELEPVLRETYGRILFQDQVLEVVRIVGQLSADEADGFQKAITHARSPEEMARLGLSLWDKVRERGIGKKTFSRLWKQIQGFAKYGFCHGHALAFADHAQGTAWLLQHHPAHFLAAVLSVEPCGFWPVSVVVGEARRRGVTVNGPCVNRSAGERWKVEDNGGAIRCSLSFVREVAKAAPAIERERAARGTFSGLQEVCRRCSFLSREQLEWLALAGALDGLCSSRRETLWSLPVLHVGHGGKAKAKEASGQTAVDMDVPPLLPKGLNDFTFAERFAREWQALSFSPAGHPLEFSRERLRGAGVLTCAALQQARPGSRVKVAGLVLRPHKPQAAGGTVFFSLEDETGLAQVTVFPAMYQKIGVAIYSHGSLVAEGIVEQRGTGRLLVAHRLEPL